MNLMDIIIGPLFKILDKIIPDPAAKAAMQLQILQLEQAGEFKEIDAALTLAQQQTDINKVEAASSDPFKSNWRPAVGWVCVSGLCYQFLVQPLLPWCVGLTGHVVPPMPQIDNATLMTLLMGMLGLGGMRTIEKLKGVA